jgi:hypothetical protein
VGEGGNEWTPVACITIMSDHIKSIATVCRRLLYILALVSFLGTHHKGK